MSFSIWSELREKCSSEVFLSLLKTVKMGETIEPKAPVYGLRPGIIRQSPNFLIFTWECWGWLSQRGPVDRHGISKAAWLLQDTWCHHRHRACDDITAMQGIWWCHSHAGYMTYPCRIHDDVTAIQDTQWHHSHAGYLMTTQPCRIHDDVTVMQDT